jgi:hypothetical protein
MVAGGDATLNAAGLATITGALDLSAGGLTMTACGPLSIVGAVDGANNLTVGGTTVVMTDTVGGVEPPTNLTFTAGTVSAGANPITAGTVTALAGDFFYFST